MKRNGVNIAGTVLSFGAILTNYIPMGVPVYVPFLIACVAIIFLAKMLGDATEEVEDAFESEALGGFLNAFFGNLTELILGIIALFTPAESCPGEAETAGDSTILDYVAKATFAGSMLGNTLLVLGMSVVVAKAKLHKDTNEADPLNFHFDVEKEGESVRQNSLLALVALGLYAIPLLVAQAGNADALQGVSFALAGIMVLYYSLFTLKKMGVWKALPDKMFFGFFKPSANVGDYVTPGDEEGCPPSKVWGLVKLGLIAILLGIVSDVIVSGMQKVTCGTMLESRKVWMGLTILAILGNVAEHYSAVQGATESKFVKATEVALGSSVQIALFVMPFIVLVSGVRKATGGAAMTLDFDYKLYIPLILTMIILFVAIRQGHIQKWVGGVLIAGWIGLAVVTFFMMQDSSIGAKLAKIALIAEKSRVITPVPEPAPVKTELPAPTGSGANSPKQTVTDVKAEAPGTAAAAAAAAPQPATTAEVPVTEVKAETPAVVPATEVKAETPAAAPATEATTEAPAAATEPKVDVVPAPKA